MFERTMLATPWPAHLNETSFAFQLRICDATRRTSDAMSPWCDEPLDLAMVVIGGYKLPRTHPPPGDCDQPGHRSFTSNTPGAESVPGKPD